MHLQVENNVHDACGICSIYIQYTVFLFHYCIQISSCLSLAVSEQPSKETSEAVRRLDAEEQSALLERAINKAEHLGFDKSKIEMMKWTKEV